MSDGYRVIDYKTTNGPGILFSPVRELDLDLLHTINLDVNCIYIEDIKDTKAKPTNYRIQQAIS